MPASSSNTFDRTWDDVNRRFLFKVGSKMNNEMNYQEKVWVLRNSSTFFVGKGQNPCIDDEIVHGILQKGYNAKKLRNQQVDHGSVKDLLDKFLTYVRDNWSRHSEVFVSKNVRQQPVGNIGMMFAPQRRPDPFQIYR